MAKITYVVFYKVLTRSDREFWVTSTLEIETPPEDPRELETAVLVKLLDRNPDAKIIDLISIDKL